MKKVLIIATTIFTVINAILGFMAGYGVIGVELFVRSLLVTTVLLVTIPVIYNYVQNS